MSDCKLNKHALIIAAIVILLCLVSVTGATFALFTSQTEDGKIGINATSGNIEVDIVDTSDKQNSLVGEALDFITTSDKKEILFEPGALYYTEGFRVKNTGEIPINFILYISEDKSISGNFFDAFEVWLTKDPTSREGMERIEDFNGRLEVGKSSEIYYLVFHMKETAGNDFQNKEFSGVGITVCAVQGNAGMPERGDDHVDID